MLLATDFRTERIQLSEVTLNVARGGTGPPLLLLHGYPQTHLMWHAVIARLAPHYTLVCPDLRGYGDSDKPAGGSDHAAYAKRAMARDMIDLMARLGYERFAAVGHDRGARVIHRLALDYPDVLERACLLDIVPTHHMFRTADEHFATGYYHWFFLIQPNGLPEHLIGCDPDYFLAEKLKRWSGPNAVFDPAAVAEYRRCFREPACLHATCEDYRAAASIDLEHDEADRHRRVDCPLLILWGAHGFVHKTYDVINVWLDYAQAPSGRALECGHFIPEEAPDALCGELSGFLAR